LAFGAPVRAQERDSDAVARAEHARFRQSIEAYRAVVAPSNRPLALGAEPLLNWGNPVRLQERGSVFVWTQAGRPYMLGSVFTYVLEDAKKYDKHEFVSLAAEPLRMTLGDQVVWAPAGNAVTWRGAPKLPSPAPSEPQRLTQMRGLARTFQVRLVSDKGDRTQLRVMPQPVFRYAAPDANVIDGAMFSFVVATDPEALLLIEAVGPAGDATWRYAFARFHYWQLDAVDASGETVWTAEADYTQAAHKRGDPSQLQKTYVSFHPNP
jgi:hypothetical protein